MVEEAVEVAAVALEVDFFYQQILHKNASLWNSIHLTSFNQKHLFKVLRLGIVKERDYASAKLLQAGKNV